VSYVYVHPGGQRPNPGDLVFRYSQRGSGDALKIEWLNEQRVVLKADAVTQVSTMRTSARSISIDYVLTGD